MTILARAVGRRKEAVAQIQIISGTGKFLINNRPAQEYLQPTGQKSNDVNFPFEILQKNWLHANSSSNEEKSILEQFDTIVKVKGGGLSGQTDAIKLGVARAFCNLANSTSSSSLIPATSSPSGTGDKQINSLSSESNVEKNEKLEEDKIQNIRKQLKTKGYLTQDARVKERRKYGLKKARKASQYHKR